MAFQAMDAALEGFRIAREKPKAMLIWAAASLLISLLAAVGMVALFGGTMNEFMAMSRTPNNDPAEAMAMIGQIGLLYAFIIPVALLVFSIFTSAVYRTVLRPAESAFGYLRLGATELRMAVVLLVLGLLSLVVSIACVIVIGIIGAVIGAVAGASGDGGIGAVLLVGVLIVVMYIGMIFVSLAFWTRFSFAGPMTFSEGRIRIFESWRATKGHFWSLLGCYIVAGILGILVSLLGGAISMAVIMAVGGGGGSTFLEMVESMQPDYSSVAAFFTAGIIANLVISSLFSALTYAIFLAPPAVAYREIAGGGADANVG
ncbi:hypothetical protein [Brevundimonas sp.]|uniref:hypothetical protein n=1 Tax=Brevundimonas sp. TaxID=1871086 RepID=UPI002D265FA1|nr:hypothetical protein [Brevundimonas sp.]HYC99499.1 hypothetical protein [Brevundimonas sp.]